jgi:hypothetical protein
MEGASIQGNCNTKKPAMLTNHDFRSQSFVGNTVTSLLSLASAAVAATEQYSYVYTYIAVTFLMEIT